MIKFFNTMDRKLEEFKSIRPNEVRMYTCGPTVYNFAHIGNFRTYMFEDLLRRYLSTHDNLRALPDYAAIQLNDTHPAIAVPEVSTSCPDSARNRAMDARMCWSSSMTTIEAMMTR